LRPGVVIRGRDSGAGPDEALPPFGTL
jgi:hypothetical protein